jgi:hypothetical protein
MNNPGSGIHRLSADSVDATTAIPDQNFFGR